jgi:hypothetical protein
LSACTGTWVRRPRLCRLRWQKYRQNRRISSQDLQQTSHRVGLSGAGRTTTPFFATRSPRSATPTFARGPTGRAVAARARSAKPQVRRRSWQKRAHRPVSTGTRPPPICGKLATCAPRLHSILPAREAMSGAGGRQCKGRAQPPRMAVRMGRCLAPVRTQAEYVTIRTRAAGKICALLMNRCNVVSLSLLPLSPSCSLALSRSCVRSLTRYLSLFSLTCTSPFAFSRARASSRSRSLSPVTLFLPHAHTHTYHLLSRCTQSCERGMHVSTFVCSHMSLMSDVRLSHRMA